ncbi:MAG: DNA mismatch repair endonuclease MutL [bacterium]
MIRILDNNLINKIAAGEVVDRPASVVKELVENSLDAGADFISVELKNGGIDLIEVADNGKGMNKDDAMLCVKRHATSKIEKIEDLNNIRSFGFRGEALAAISSVSRFSLQTKEKGAISGVILSCGSESLIIDNGCYIDKSSAADDNKWEIKDIGCSEGAKIRAENLFYNIPARKKFLKSAQTEFNHILNTLTDISLSNFGVRLKLVHNGKIIFDYLADAKQREEEHKTMQKNDNWDNRVKVVLGNDNFSKMIPFYQEAGEMILCGFASSLTDTHSIKGQQYLFVNNRPVRNNIVHKAIYEAYRNLVPAGSHPNFVIKLDLEPELVDVNVHPRKMEVKFLRQQDVFKMVEAVVREAVTGRKFRNLETNKLDLSYGYLASGNNVEIRNKSQNQNLKFQNVEQYKTQERNNISRLSSFLPCSREGLNEYGRAVVKDGKQQDAVRFFNDSMFGAEKREGEESSWKLIGQIKNLYLIVETIDGIILIDQHAAHERIIYDSIIEKIKQENYKFQQLFVPLKIELSLREMVNLKQNFEILKKIGFEIEEFGTNTIIVQTVPQDISGKNVEEIIRGIINDLLSFGSEDLKFNEKTLEEARNKVVCYISCRSAIMAGDKISLEEQTDLVRKVMSGEVKATCPHGRPIISILRWDEIGKRFKRNS